MCPTLPHFFQLQYKLLPCRKTGSDNPLFARANETIPEASQGKEFKELTLVKTKIDFSQALSYVHVDDTTYTVMGENITFSTLTLRPTIIFQPPDSIKK